MKGPSRALSGPAKIWLLSAALAGLTVGICVAAPIAAPGASPREIPWWAIAVGFAAAEIFVVYVEIRREAYSLSLGEVPLVIGLFLLSPAELVLAQCAGAIAALVIYRRQSPLKVAFNVSHLSLEAALAAVAFAAIAGTPDPSDPFAWLGAFVATSITALVADAAVHAAITFAGNEGFSLRTMFEGFALTRAMQVTNTSLGLLAVQLLWVSPWVAALLAIPVAAVLLSYRAYNRQRARHESLQFLHDTTRQLHETSELDEAVSVVLSQARRMFKADVAELLHFPASSTEDAVRWRVGPGDELEVEADLELRPTEGVWARVAAEEQPLLLARPIANERLAEHFGAQGIKDAMIAPLIGEMGIAGTRVHGLMLVGNRLSDVATFDEEDLALFTTLAHHADSALQNARLLSRLRSSLDELQEMNRQKDEFVAVVSHELRTPLTVITGAVKTVRVADDRLSGEDREALLDSAERATDRLSSMVEQLLAAARLEHAPASTERRVVEVNDLVMAVVADFQHGIGARRLLVDLPKDLPGALGDPSIVYRILVNLVENALKYSDADSVVTIEGRGDRGEVVVSIRDQGRGIAPDVRERIFERFYQGDSSATRSVGGVGLGLYLCRRFAEEIGGRVWLERSDADGSVFSLALPSAGFPLSDANQRASLLTTDRL